MTRLHVMSSVCVSGKKGKFGSVADMNGDLALTDFNSVIEVTQHRL